MRQLRWWLIGGASLLVCAPAYGQGVQGAIPAPPSANTPTPGSNASDKATTGGASASPSDRIAAAHGTGPSPAAQPDTTALGEIIVTAQRRAQNLLSVPLSISATTGPQLQASGIRQISQLQYTTPGFLPQQGVGYTQIYIRGIGNNIFVGADPSVATYVDDVPRIYGSLVNNFVNVERVEVLKGAQGGLYGRNATGGVVNIITRQPSSSYEAEARVSYGTKNTLDAQAYLNVPFGDQIAWNFAAERSSHDYYVKNLEQPNPLTPAMFPNGGGPVLATVGVVTPAQTAAFFNSAIRPSPGYGDQDFWSVDSKLRVKFTDDLKITIDGDYSRKRDSEGNQWFLTSPAYSQAVDTAILGGFGVQTAFPPDFYKYPGKFENYNSTPAADWLTDYGGSVRTEWSLPGVDVTDIFAYRAQQTFYSMNYAHPITLDLPIVQNAKWYWYQELRAVSTGPGPFHFLAGATYLRDHFDGLTTNYLLPPIYTVPIPAVQEATQSITQSNDEVRNWSVYGQLGYDLTEALTLEVSGRYIHETNEALFTLPVISTAHVESNKFLPSATLSYRLGGGGNIYVRYAKGFKAGGVNPVVPPTFFPTDYGKVFGPEEVDTYEAGLKNSLFDHRVQLSTAIFYNDYTGLQTQATGNADHPALIQAIVNAGTARSYGAEGSVTWRVSRGLTLSANAAYLEATYKNFKIADATVLSAFDFSGQRMIYAPKWQLGFTGDYDRPINDRYRLVVNALTSYVSTVRAGFSPVAVLPDPTLPPYWLTNLRVGVRTTDDRYGVSLFVNNLFDKGYFTFGSVNSLGSNVVWGDPRIIGAQVEAKFR